MIAGPHAIITHDCARGIGVLMMRDQCPGDVLVELHLATQIDRHVLLRAIDEIREAVARDDLSRYVPIAEQRADVIDLAEWRAAREARG